MLAKRNGFAIVDGWYVQRIHMARYEALAAKDRQAAREFWFLVRVDPLRLAELDAEARRIRYRQRAQTTSSYVPAFGEYECLSEIEPTGE